VEKKRGKRERWREEMGTMGKGGSLEASFLSSPFPAFPTPFNFSLFPVCAFLPSVTVGGLCRGERHGTMFLR